MKVNLQTIATACQVSCNTVSRALRNDPKISTRTRQRVRKKAEELGYEKDAEISRLMAYMAKRRRTDRVHSEICYLSTFCSVERHPTHPHYFHHLQTAALKLGYRVEPYFLGKGGYTPKTLQRTLYHRNIRGVILAPAHPQAPLDEIDWSGYAPICLGQSYPKIHFNRFHWDLQWNVVECIQQLRQAGYRRIGFIMSPWVDRLMGFPVAAGNAIFRAQEPKAEPVLMLYDLLLDKPHRKPKLIRDWILKHRPEVVVASDGYYEAIKKVGLQMPEELSYAEWNLSLWGDQIPPEFSGVHPSLTTFAEQIIQTIVGRLNENFLGLPKSPSLTLIEGYWRKGSTTWEKKTK